MIKLFMLFASLALSPVIAFCDDDPNLKQKSSSSTEGGYSVRQNPTNTPTKRGDYPKSSPYQGRDPGTEWTGCNGSNPRKCCDQSPRPSGCD